MQRKLSPKENAPIAEIERPGTLSTKGQCTSTPLISTRRTM